MIWESMALLFTGHGSSPSHSEAFAFLCPAFRLAKASDQSSNAPPTDTRNHRLCSVNRPHEESLLRQNWFEPPISVRNAGTVCLSGFRSRQHPRKNVRPWACLSVIHRQQTGRPIARSQAFTGCSNWLQNAGIGMPTQHVLALIPALKLQFRALKHAPQHGIFVAMRTGQGYALAHDYTPSVCACSPFFSS